MDTVVERSQNDRRKGSERRTGDDSRPAKMQLNEGERRSGEENRTDQERRT